MKYIILTIIFFLPAYSYASVKDEIKKKLENTNSIYFGFYQKINDKIEKGNCKLSYPKKIYCKYDDIYNKILVSNGRSLIINSDKIKNYLKYNLKDTALDLILDKKFFIKKIAEFENIDENIETYSVKLKHKDNIITIYFDKDNFDVQGWKTIDIYQNEVETKLFDIKSNIMIDESIFKIQKYIN